MADGQLLFLALYMQHLLTKTVDVLFTGDTTVTLVVVPPPLTGLGAGLGATVGFGFTLGAGALGYVFIEYEASGLSTNSPFQRLLILQ